MENKIKVSVCCMAYNQQKYIRKMLDGIVMQKTSFLYEVIIHDDASTDETASIIREYEKEYPGIFKPIYQTENQYSRGKHISFTFLYPRAQGKYIAVCEGDDFWTDPNKLQKQFDMMEKYENCALCTHTVEKIKEDGTPSGKYYPNPPIKEGVIYAEDAMNLLLLKGAYPFQTSCYFFRSKDVAFLKKSIPKFMAIPRVGGDSKLLLLLASKGDFYYIAEEMSSYRMQSEGSWNSRERASNQGKLKIRENYIEVCRAFNDYTDGKYADKIEYCIHDLEFQNLILKKQYKSLQNSAYQDLYRALSTKEQFYYKLLRWIPWLEGPYKKLKTMFK